MILLSRAVAGLLLLATALPAACRHADDALREKHEYERLAKRIAEAFPARAGEAAAVEVASVSPPSPDSLRGKPGDGATLAMAGETARAESVFVSLLSRAPGDPRALANLGNLYFLRGELDSALAHYDRALRSDSTDAGVRLNRAITYMMLGDQERAEAEAAECVKIAGGPESAAALVGIQDARQWQSGGHVAGGGLLGGTGGIGGAGGAIASELSPRMILGLLRRANQRLSQRQVDGLFSQEQHAAQPGKSPLKDRRRPEASRPLKAKASREAKAAALLYWKR